MTKRFDLYGWTELSLDEAATQVRAALNVVLELHDSSYRGGDYYLWRSEKGEELIIQRNFEDEDGYLAEQDHPSYATLLYASGSDAETLAALANMPGLIRLRTEVL
jgi:hypothetical protein